MKKKIKVSEIKNIATLNRVLADKLNRPISDVADVIAKLSEVEYEKIKLEEKMGGKSFRRPMHFRDDL